MKRICSWMLAGIGIVLAGATTDMVWAQSAPVAPGPYGVPGVTAPADKRVLVVRRMPKLGRVKQPTPQYSAVGGTRGQANRPRDWAVFEATYDTVPEWLDEVVVTYYLMSEHRAADGKREFSFFQTTVRYADVARGEHTACVVLPPAALLRYGDQFIGFAAEFSVAGTLQDAKSEVTAALPQPEWWKKPEVTESKSVVRRDGLVDRSKTPFALINIDDYEAVK